LIFTSIEHSRWLEIDFLQRMWLLLQTQRRASSYSNLG